MSVINTVIGIDKKANVEFTAAHPVPYMVMCDPVMEKCRVQRAFTLAPDTLMRFRLIINLGHILLHMPVAEAVHNPDDCIQFHGPELLINQYIQVVSVMLIDDIGFLIGEDRRTSNYLGNDDMQIHFALYRKGVKCQ